MQSSSKFKWITDRRVQGVALLLIAAAGLRQATLAGSGSSSTVPTAAPAAYPLVAIARDFRPGMGDFAQAMGDTLPTSVGNLARTLNDQGVPVYVGSGLVLTSPAKNAAGRNILPSAVTARPVTNFNISGAQVSSTQAMVAKITVVGAAIASGSTPCPVATRINVGAAEHQPFGFFASPTSGNLNDSYNPRSVVLPGTIASGTPISVDGQSWLPGAARPYMTVNSARGGAQVKALRNNDDVPNVSGFSGQVSAKDMLGPYLSADKSKIKLNANQVIYLFELGTTSTGSAAFDMQDLVVLVDLATDASYFEGPTTPTVTDACGHVVNDIAATFGAAHSGGITSAYSFAQWYQDVPGMNVSQRIFLSMTRDAAGVYSYSTPDFTPIDGEMYGNQNAPHNRGFTCSIDAIAGYKKCGGQFIEYAGSGDGWLFVNGVLALDLGGTHTTGSQTVFLDRLNLADDAEVRVQFFYAQRTSTAATFALRTNMVLTTPNSVGLPGVSGILD